MKTLDLLQREQRVIRGQEAEKMAPVAQKSFQNSTNTSPTQ